MISDVNAFNACCESNATHYCLIDSDGCYQMLIEWPFFPLSVIPGKKFKTKDRHRARLPGKIKSAVLPILYWIHFYMIFPRKPEVGTQDQTLMLPMPRQITNAKFNFVIWHWVVDNPVNWHILLFRVANFHSYWHMPFQVSTVT